MLYCGTGFVFLAGVVHVCIACGRSEVIPTLCPDCDARAAAKSNICMYVRVCICVLACVCL